MTAVAATTTVVAPVPPSNNRGGLFPQTAFAIEGATETVTCPGGQTVSYATRRPRRDGRRVVRWASATCQACPLRPQCVAGTRPRSLQIRPDEAAIQVARQEQATAAWQAHYRLRSHVEHVQAQQSRHGGRQGRYWGARKTLWQERMVAVAYNIMELARVAALPPPEPREACV